MYIKQLYSLDSGSAHERWRRSAAVYCREGPQVCSGENPTVGMGSCETLCNGCPDVSSVSHRRWSVPCRFGFVHPHKGALASFVSTTISATWGCRTHHGNVRSRDTSWLPRLRHSSIACAHGISVG